MTRGREGERRRRVLGIVAAATAGLFLIVGAAAAKWYLWDVVVGQRGEPDRSMLFWGLPVLFLGVSALLAAAGLAWFARQRLSEKSEHRH